MMTKKFSRGLAALLLMFAAFGVSAKAVDLSYHASGPGWEEFSQALIADKLMKPGENDFDSKGLTTLMFNMLSPAQKASVAQGDFVEIVVALNKIPKRIQVSEFPAIAQSLRIPDIQVIAQATPGKPEASAPQMRLPQVTSRNVRGQLVELEKLSKDFSDLHREVKDLKAASMDAVTKTQYQELVNEVQQFSDTLSVRLNIVELDVGSLKQGQAELSGRIDNLGLAQQGTAGGLSLLQEAVNELEVKLETKFSNFTTDTSLLWKAVFALAVAVLVLCIFCFALWRRSTAVVKIASDFVVLDTPAANSGNVQRRAA